MATRLLLVLLFLSGCAEPVAKTMPNDLRLINVALHQEGLAPGARYVVGSKPFRMIGFLSSEQRLLPSLYFKIVRKTRDKKEMIGLSGNVELVRETEGKWAFELDGKAPSTKGDYHLILRYSGADVGPFEFQVR